MERRNNEKSKGLVGWFLVIIIILQGCAAVKPQANFVDNKIELKQCKEDTSKFWWEKQGFNWHNYDKIMVEPIAIQMDKNNFKQEELQTAVNDFQKIITQGLSPEYLVVDEPGPNVLRLRCAITAINTSNPALNALTTLAIFMPLDMGGATIEVEFFNSITGERVAAMVDQKTGTPLQLKSSFSQFGQAKGAFEDWAKELKLALVTNP